VVRYEHKSDADEAIQTLRSQAPYMDLDIQKGNVVVTFDYTPHASTVKRIRTALAQLPS
jgi:hypothetical protein